ncbi:hypothetical protein TNCV_2603921 [Trichonephila clavipes]|nr:hypothetical protein TNCV_2603921 [Trichonephila clavipes]
MYRVSDTMASAVFADPIRVLQGTKAPPYPYPVIICPQNKPGFIINITFFQSVTFHIDLATSASNLNDTKYHENYPFMRFFKITVPNVVGYLNKL